MGAGDEELGVVRLACAAMGTRFELLLHGGERCELLAAGEAALDEVLLWHARLSAFEASSVLSHIHRAGGEWCSVDGETFGLLMLCREMWRVTQGAFDPTVGGLMRAWGLRERDFDAGEVEAASRLTGMGLVELDEAVRGVRLPAQARLDLGAIGKGWALDRAAEVLVEAGVSSALLHAGTSSVRGIGLGVGGSAWRVGVAGSASMPVVELTGLAMGVSAPHGRRSCTAHGSVGHVMDPVRRAPVDLGPEGSAAVCAAVVGESAAIADAMSTALLVRPGLLDVLAGYEGTTAAMIARNEDGTVHWTVRDRDGLVTSATEQECVHV